MEKINPNDPAFPHRSPAMEGGHTSPGISIRTQLAADAMRGLLSSEFNNESLSSPGTVAEWAVQYADALIEELNK